MRKVSSWKELTLREKIGQTVISLQETDKQIKMCGSLEAFLEKYPIGGLFNNTGIVKGLMVGNNLNFGDTISEYNKYLRVPMFATADYGSYATQFGIELPPQMALGAADDEELAYSAGEFKAEDSKKTGINWLFWPVCDLSISNRSPVNDIRSVSDKGELNVKIVKEELRAMKEKGVISTLKHYPGYPYDDNIDSHIAMTDNETPIDIWRNTYGKMYKELFSLYNPPSIMTAHMNLVNYQTEKVDGVYPPATLSYELTTNLLRKELGFKGVTVTDALVMGGFAGNQAVEKCIESFLAGNDVLLWPSYEYIDEMEKRILSGEIDEKILDEAVERIWNLKAEYGILDCEEKTSDANKEFFADIVEKISDKSLTLINNYNNLLPLDKEKIKNVLIVGVTPNDKQYENMCVLKSEFEKYNCNVKMQRNIWTDEIETAKGEYDLILFGLCRTPHHPIGPIDFWGEEGTTIWASNCSDKNKTVIASFGSPYVYKYYKSSGVTYINAYTCQAQTISAFVKALFGDGEFFGKSSVEL